MFAYLLNSLLKLEEMDGQVPHYLSESLNTTHSNAEEADISAGSVGLPLSVPTSGRRPSVREEEDPIYLLDLQYPPSDSIRDSSPALPASNPCRNVPGLWFVKVGSDASKILEVKFVVEPEFSGDLLQTCALA